jgi:hypothetical protein
LIFCLANDEQEEKTMAFKDLVNKAQEVTGSAAEASGKLLDEFNEALPTMRALGFAVSDFRVGMGLLPEIGAKLIASTDTVDPKKINELIEKQKERKTLVMVLKTLEAAYNIRQQIGSIPFKGVEIDMTLGLPPRVGVGFVSATPSVPATTAPGNQH